MILTLTLSPVLDKSATVPRFQPGHKLRCQELRYHPGGGGINVSRALHELGAATCALFPYGGPGGELLTQLLQREGVPYKGIRSESATRASFSVDSESGNEQFRFVEPAVPLARTELEQLLRWDNWPDAAWLVLSGSMPPGLPAGFLGRVVQQARRRGMQVVADTSGPALQELLQAGSYLAKPSLAELEFLTGTPGLTASDVQAAARSLLGRYPLSALVVSLGADGACLVTPEDTQLIPAPPATATSTVGAGDSLVAGLVWRLSEGDTLPAATAFGVACGSAATEGHGTDLFTRAAAWRKYADLKNWLNRPAAALVIR